MHIPSVHSQAENYAIAQLIGPTGQSAYLGAKRQADNLWQWYDGTPWDFEAWEPGRPRDARTDDNQEVPRGLAIKWLPDLGVIWQDDWQDESKGVICAAPSVLAIKGAVPDIVRLAGPKNAMLIATSVDQ
jgi:hypothetical protein